MNADLYKTIKLQCKGPNETEWSTLNQDVLPLGNTAAERKARDTVEKEMQHRLTYWPRAYLAFSDHAFRIVRE